MPDHVDFYLNFLQKFWRGQKVICALQNHKTIASSKLQKFQVLQSIVLQTFLQEVVGEDIPMPDHVDFYLNFLQTSLTRSSTRTYPCPTMLIFI